MKAYKTEVILSFEQQDIFNRTVGTCRYVYNLFIATNIERHEQGLPFVSSYDFSKWLNHEYVTSGYIWIKDVSTKAVSNSINNANAAFMKFFKKKSRFPRFKKKGKNDCNYYFVRGSKSQIINCDRHRIKVPCMGWVRLREYGYIPIPSNAFIISGTITRQAGRYFISVLTDEEQAIQQNNTGAGIGIDLGVKDFAILSDGTVYKTNKQKKLNKRLKREQRKLSRKYETNKSKIKKGEATKGIERQKRIVAQIQMQIANVRNDYQNKIVSEIISRKPKFITLENLNVSGMMKNRHLSKAIANQGFNMFVTKLTNKAKVNGIEIRKVDRFYPSSKLCSHCGSIKKDLKLSDRVYKCECGNVIDRDLNAAINLRNATEYTIAQ